MRSPFAALIILQTLSLNTFSLGAAPASDATIEELIQAGKNTVEKHLFTAATWTVKYRLLTGDVFEAKVVRDGTDQSWIFSHLVNRRPQLICQLIQKDGLWHVIEKGRTAKFRPFEADLRLPGGYLLFSLSDVCVVLDSAMWASAVLEKREKNIRSYRVPLPPESRRVMEQVVSEYDGRVAKEPAVQETEDLAETTKYCRELLARGIPVRVDEKTGILIQWTMRDLLITVEEFRWLNKTPRGAFDLPKNVSWDDQSQPLSEADLDQCVMVSHDPLFVMGAQGPSPDGYLLDLKTGRLRRLPYQGFLSMPACFLKDRKEVVVAGWDTTGEMGLLMLNLISGANIPLAYGSFKGRLSAMADLAPDGHTIATLQKFTGSNVLDAQILVMDMHTRESRVLGQPANIGAPFCWLPEGDGLILKRLGSPESPHGIEPRILCRLGLDGKLMDLRRGDWPVVLRKTRRILYEEGEHGPWRTCNLDGSDTQPYADGMREYGIPAVSPDESRILFVRYRKGEMPQLMLFEVGKTEGRRVGQAGGFTSMPVWR